MGDEIRVTVIATGFDHGGVRAAPRGDAAGAARPRAADRRPPARLAGDPRRRPRHPAVPALSPRAGGATGARGRPRTASTPARTSCRRLRSAAQLRGAPATVALGSAAHGRRCRIAQANPPVRPARRGRCEARPLRRLGDAGPVRGHPRGASRGPRAARGSSTSRTWARSRPSGPAPRPSCSGSSPTTCRRSPSAARSTASCAARTAACSTTCSPTGSTDDRFLTVTNAANHEKDLAWFQAHAEGFDVTLHDRLHELRDARRPGPAGARDRHGARRRATCPTASAPRRLTVAGAADVLVCGTGYTGEDGVELLVAPEHAPAVWDALVAGRRGARRPRRARHAAPGGLLSPLRQRPDGEPRPDRGRPRLVLQGGHGLHRRGGRQGRPRARPGGEARRRSSSRARASRARAIRSAAGAR